jgi:hypothetical protein
VFKRKDDIFKIAEVRAEKIIYDNEKKEKMKE